MRRYLGPIALITFVFYCIISTALKEEPKPIPTATWYDWDIRNGRPIYPEDTLTLFRHPFNSDTWINAEERDSINANKIKTLNRQKRQIPVSPSSKKKLDMEDNVIQYINQNLD